MVVEALQSIRSYAPFIDDKQSVPGLVFRGDHAAVRAVIDLEMIANKYGCKEEAIIWKLIHALFLPGLLSSSFQSKQQHTQQQEEEEMDEDYWRRQKLTYWIQFALSNCPKYKSFDPSTITTTTATTTTTTTTTVNVDELAEEGEGEEEKVFAEAVRHLLRYEVEEACCVLYQAGYDRLAIQVADISRNT